MPAKQPSKAKPKPKPKPKLQAPVVYVPEPIAVRPDEAARLLGISRRAMFRVLASGEIRSVKMGHTRLVPTAEIRAWIARELDEQQGVA